MNRPRTLLDLLDSAAKDNIPPSAVMAAELGIDAVELVDAVLGAAALNSNAEERDAMEVFTAVMSWGVALGYYYALKTYDRKLGLVP